SPDRCEFPLRLEVPSFRLLVTGSPQRLPILAEGDGGRILHSTREARCHPPIRYVPHGQPAEAPSSEELAVVAEGQRQELAEVGRNAPSVPKLFGARGTLAIR